MAELQENPTATMPAGPASSDATWCNLIPTEQWEVLRDGSEALEQAGAPFLLAGALALATYTGHWRNTKDIDVVIQEVHREAVIESLSKAGFEDYFERENYDRSWIFRGFKDGVLFDVIWALPNHRVGIDEAWFARAQSI